MATAGGHCWGPCRPFRGMRSEYKGLDLDAAPEMQWVEAPDDADQGTQSLLGYFGSWRQVWQGLLAALKPMWDVGWVMKQALMLP